MRCCLTAASDEVKCTACVFKLNLDGADIQWVTAQIKDFSTTLKCCLFVFLFRCSLLPLLAPMASTVTHSWLLNTDISCLSERLSQQEVFVLRHQPLHPPLWVFFNSTPLDVWEAQLVVDHKALNPCLLIKHSTQWMHSGTLSLEQS